MPSIQLTSYTIACAGQSALWRVKTLWNGREVGREVLNTSDTQHRLDAVRAERARLAAHQVSREMAVGPI